MAKNLELIFKILKRHEKRLREMNFDKFIKKFLKRKLGFQQQTNRYKGVHLALCVDTRDPLKQNRVKFFSPVMHIPIQGGDVKSAGAVVEEVATTLITQLDWAWPISSMGGFDDCGLTWVPPPGSTVCLIFANDSPDSAYYIGTTWHRDRGPLGDHNWNYDIPEYDKIFEGHRNGYMVGKNDESQVLPPWNTDNYQGYDIDSTVKVNLVPDAETKTTWPHIYGFSTPEKHRLKMDDGDPKCNRRWKRLEIMSSMGAYFLMKDDPYHHCGEWNNPQCSVSYVDVVPSICIPSYISVVTPSGISMVAVPYPCEQGPENCSTIQPESWSLTADQEYLGNEHLCPGFQPFSESDVMPVDCMGKLRGQTDFCFTFNNKPNNIYHKHRQECFPFYCDHCGLPQSGMQLLARSGHTIVMDDSVEEPREKPEWERTNKKFDMDGCTGNFKGRMFLRSATGHYILFNDAETQPKVRGINNGITISSACGNVICLNDHSKPTGINDDGSVTGCIAGEMRGVHIESTAKHTLDFVDDTNQQCSNERTGCSKTGAYAKKAFIRMRSGYGLTFTMADFADQTKTDQQYIQILSPQKDNLVRGPHMLHMQEKADGAGQVFLRAGGNYIVYSYDDAVEIVGDEKDNPANKLEFVSKNKIVSVNEVYYNRSKTHAFWADDFIFLAAGKDCEDSEGEGQPCVYPVCVAVQPIPDFVTAVTGIKASEHVFASAKELAPCDKIQSD